MNFRPIMLVAALVVVLTVSGPPAPAEASCGGVKTTTPKRKVNPRGHAPLAIGDSTMLLALPDLARVGYQVNARGCRGWNEGMSVLKDYKRKKRLPHLVVIALGADYSVSRGDIRKALRILGRKRVLGLVTPRELGGWSGSDARNMRRAYQSNYRRIILLDWVEFSQGNGKWFQPDGLHLTFPGAAAFARLAGKATPWAKAGEFPDRVRFPKSR